MIVYLKDLSDPFIEHKGFTFELSYYNGYDVILIGHIDKPFSVHVYKEQLLSSQESEIVKDYMMVKLINEVLNGE